MTKYQNCKIIVKRRSVQAHEYSGDGTVSETDDGDGTVTQTLTCPEATSELRYSTPDPQTITCSKTTGKYDNQLGACYKERPSKGKNIEQAWSNLPFEVGCACVNARALSSYTLSSSLLEFN